MFNPLPHGEWDGVNWNTHPPQVEFTNPSKNLCTSMSRDYLALITIIHVNQSKHIKSYSLNPSNRTVLIGF